MKSQLEMMALNTLENILVKDPEHLKTLYQLGITLSRSPNSDDKERHRTVKKIKYHQAILHPQ